MVKSQLSNPIISLNHDDDGLAPTLTNITLEYVIMGLSINNDIISGQTLTAKEIFIELKNKVIEVGFAINIDDNMKKLGQTRRDQIE